MIIAIIREGKMPRDTRSPLTPDHCKKLLANYKELQIFVQKSPHRCFSDEEYRLAGCTVLEDLSKADVLLGVKEVPIPELIPDKTYFFFSHTIKKQAHNRELLKAIIAKRIRMVDYECLVGEDGRRLIGFGYFAGIVGAYNALQTYGIKSGSFVLAPATTFLNLAEILKKYAGLEMPIFKTVLTGGGKVARGAAEVLKAMGIREVSKEEFISKEFEKAVFVKLENEELYVRRDGKPYVREDFFTHPSEYTCPFAPLFQNADLMINGVYWAPGNPVFFTLEQLKTPGFRIKVIADITCDIAPAASLPTTLRATKIGDAIFGFDPLTGTETAPFTPGCIDVMSIDNLPNELPRDASGEFGRVLSEIIFPELLKPESEVISKATICKDGLLTPKFSYLANYVDNFLSI